MYKAKITSVYKYAERKMKQSKNKYNSKLYPFVDKAKTQTGKQGIITSNMGNFVFMKQYFILKSSHNFQFFRFA